MAQLVGILQTSHGPFTTLEPERWESVRSQRSYRPDVPVESREEAVAKHQRTKAGLAVLRQKLEELKPDVLVIFGDDQLECFDFNNFPALSLYVGEEFAGPILRGGPHQKVPGHRDLATALLIGLIERGFDPAFSMDLPNRDKGMCHAVMRPLEFLTDYSIPTIPLLVNGYYPPQAPAVRCYQVGRAVRQILDQYPGDLRVAVVGSGGLWHTPGRKNSYLDEEFDRAQLDYLARGDIKGMAEHFDGYKVPPDDESQDIYGRGMSGLPAINGPQMGTRETCNWIGAGAVADGRPSVIVDYIPIYASPIGTAFAYCDDL